GGLEALGQLDLAKQWAEQALKLSPDDPPTRYNMACFYARMGETEKALDLLEGSIRSRSWIENDPDMDSLRDSPRYKAIIQSLSN
ncbi:MAG TPA: tetratricopeptide repeat protein, partial [Xanthomonadales bacterium]|nr:tetratricopeptide repeat protein [Xanthomonadales bacterium]